MSASEIPLSGGFVSGAVRVGNTVRRPRAERSRFVRELLSLFERAGWPGAPRFLGVDESGREVLGFLDGHVAWEPDQPPEVCSEASLTDVARLVRQFHDLTAGTALAGAAEVVCHNDLSPKNTVYRDSGAGLRPAAFIDWDIAAPGERIHDVAHVCWQYVGLGPGVRDVADAGRQMRLICDTYGLSDRDRLVATVLWWQDRCARGIEDRAAAGDPAMIRLCDGGAVESVRVEHHWVEANRAALDAWLR